MLVSRGAIGGWHSVQAQVAQVENWLPEEAQGAQLMVATRAGASGANSKGGTTGGVSVRAGENGASSRSGVVDRTRETSVV